MALINCKECGKEVSDTVTNCIHCGFELSTAKPISYKPNLVNKKSSGSGLWILFLIIIIGIPVFIGLQNFESGSDSTLNVIERDLRSSDFQISHSQGLTSVTVTVIPKTDIKTFTLSFTLFNSSEQVIWSDMQTRTNLKRNNSTSITFNFGISGALTGGRFSISPSGKVAVWN